MINPTLAAMVFLNERVSWLRWVGVGLIMLGAGLISYTEHAKEKPPADRAAASTGGHPAAPDHAH
jgi:drug/metabolite transporter (DMT)-like permease